ncbi:MAG: hypothetical protein KF709_13380 [Gemmatimonadaceae bacterium]|nr:hypothetical protein [Gemmatimonadaceae bacterium]
MLPAGACGLLTGPLDGDAHDLRGEWALSGAQSSPSLQIVGEISITTQHRGEIFGTAQWEERDGFGGVTVAGGTLAGIVATVEDVDFDVQIGGNPRRFIGRIVADTIAGTWIQAVGGLSGTFRAVRGATP